MDFLNILKEAVIGAVRMMFIRAITTLVMVILLMSVIQAISGARRPAAADAAFIRR